MTATQLALELWDQLQQAQQMPEAVDVAQLLDEVEAAAAQLPETQRSQFAGDALLQIAELCAMRAEVLMIQWEELVRDPIVEQSFFADVVRQSMAVDLSDLMKPARSRQKEQSRLLNRKNRLRLPLTKQQCWQWLTARSRRRSSAETVCFDRPFRRSGWTAAILEWLQTTLLSVSIAELSDSLEMRWIEVWLGVLFGGFRELTPANFGSQ
ncbi:MULTISPECIES: hypothetical protein [unclassified Leptolyngbya]|uniref:hypothetical protein n=1 Tax=unclassified Leptolyngbya TaxID=2650499 RepID=UPI0016873875|nr:MULTISPECIES: hypothetical protein [unclassified Leptolyngbya]MBD1908985.1 hypothetical protein [Leptolyngbya sp. FACHB-8]MBD2153012.1 hypothetical protein [Leptolyngbya sp. FACHB-16]